MEFQCETHRTPTSLPCVSTGFSTLHESRGSLSPQGGSEKRAKSISRRAQPLPQQLLATPVMHGPNRHAQLSCRSWRRSCNSEQGRLPSSPPARQPARDPPKLRQGREVRPSDDAEALPNPAAGNPRRLGHRNARRFAQLPASSWRRTPILSFFAGLFPRPGFSSVKEQLGADLTGGSGAFWNAGQWRRSRTRPHQRAPDLHPLLQQGPAQTLAAPEVTWQRGLVPGRQPRRAHGSIALLRSLGGSGGRRSRGKALLGPADGWGGNGDVRLPQDPHLLWGQPGGARHAEGS